jgi:hypothetical protein
MKNRICRGSRKVKRLNGRLETNLEPTNGSLNTKHADWYHINWFKVGFTITVITLVLVMAGCIGARDSDDDGYPDEEDMFPQDPGEWIDSDNDGVGDNSDAFPNDPLETLDTDGDGYGDSTDVFPDDSTEWIDTDEDGVGDNRDAFPDDPAEAYDTDGDGYGDSTDVFPDDSTEWVDLDRDGYGDNVADKFPKNPLEWSDADGDGRGDNSDVFPNNSQEWWDSDGDGVGDNTDPFPKDRSEWSDQDKDGYGDNFDLFPDDPDHHKICTECNGTGITSEKDYFDYSSSHLLWGEYVYQWNKWHIKVTVKNEDTTGGIFKVNGWLTYKGETLFGRQAEHYIDAGETYEFDLPGPFPPPITWMRNFTPGQSDVRYEVNPPFRVIGPEITCPTCQGTGKE